MQAAYLGIAYTDKEIVKVINKYRAKAEHMEDAALLTDTIAREIAAGKVVGWFEGRMEFGPRALGHRSILADPRNPEMQKKLNIKIKFREGFRPFAPLMLQEEADRLFGLQQPSPYMLFMHPIKEQFRKPLPANYNTLSLMEKLYVQRSELPAITHIDFSARIQTVAEADNPQVYQLLHAFKKLTGYGVLINTSFNVRGEPIVCSPDDAYACFMQTDMDMLVLGNFVFYKERQPNADAARWKREFAGD
jgi:carbamoyltransferase